ncbi:serine/threonine protein kinase [Candidatus Uabimicrobium amorphum]|uniref:Serine/threonine protein kinase n=1 Tax=Uabimicrobium amorphum TaxID=2596890 RepID=A0A5S9IVJ5_UABAM|nr:serine/threonine-protein kinase [Candidatus Uabimicrobium amorphum]BBM88072.1 serine/threonine protein kinase [Candidatus Uabimicrobium amorphum]
MDEIKTPATSEPSIKIYPYTLTPVKPGDTIWTSYEIDSDDPQQNLAAKKYEEIKEIGRGGMGRVELWKDKNINRVVAAKMLLKEHQKSKQALKGFLEEAQISGQLEHPNIVPIHDIGKDASGNLFFTMKYVEGKSLHNLIEDLKNDPQKKQYFSLNKLLQIMQSICHSIDYAHAKNVIHRDLKPNNIMLGNFGEVMVMDWGIAKILESKHDILDTENSIVLKEKGQFQTITGKIVGTPIYMSPEQAQAEWEKIDTRTDIYALGAILFEMVTGKKMIDASNILEAVFKASNGKKIPFPKKGIFGSIPPELQSIIEKATAFQPQDRYQKASDMSQDIQNFIDHSPVKAHSYSTTEKLAKIFAKWKREIFLVLVTAFVMTTAFSIYKFYEENHAALQHERKADRILAELEKLQSQNINPQDFLNKSIASMEEYGSAYDEKQCDVCKLTLEKLISKKIELSLIIYKKMKEVGNTQAATLLKGQIRDMNRYNYIKKDHPLYNEIFVEK